MRQLWNSVEEVLDYAIAEEQKAMANYRAFAGQSASAEMKRLFAGFAVDEARHAGEGRFSKGKVRFDYGYLL